MLKRKEKGKKKRKTLKKERYQEVCLVENVGLGYLRSHNKRQTINYRFICRALIAFEFPEAFQKFN